MFYSCEHLSFQYAEKTVLEDVSFTLSSGKLVGLLGENGSGKTTLLRCLACVLPHEGRSTLSGRTLETLRNAERARLCAYVPQSSGISVEMTVLEAVLMGFYARLGLLEAPDQSMKGRALAALAQVGLAEEAHSSYFELSRGQQQLCILARALLNDGQLLLLDEPESAMDYARRSELMKLLRGWISEHSSKRSAIVSLHDPVLALNQCDELLLLRNGRIADIIIPQSDSCERMSELLSSVYGSVCVQKAMSAKGRQQLVLLWEN